MSFKFSKTYCLNTDFISQTAPIATVVKSIPKVSNECQFNPSIIQTKQGKLMAFRESIDGQIYRSRLACVYLSESLGLKGSPSYLNELSPAEDPRLICVNDRTFLTFTRLCPDSIFRHYICELSLDEKVGVKPGSILELVRPIPRRSPHEKNWVPFQYDYELYFIYFTYPHIVLRWALDEGKPLSIYTTWPNLRSWAGFGKPRGGTPAVLTEYGYLTFFHSYTYISGSTVLVGSPRQYYLGAYIFESSPPFSIKKITNTPLQAVGFYTIHNKLSAHKVVFPLGLLAIKDKLIVSFGDMDSRISFLEMDLHQLVANMIPVLDEYSEA